MKISICTTNLLAICAPDLGEKKYSKMMKNLNNEGKESKNYKKVSPLEKWLKKEVAEDRAETLENQAKLATLDDEITDIKKHIETAFGAIQDKKNLIIIN